MRGVTLVTRAAAAAKIPTTNWVPAFENNYLIQNTSLPKAVFHQLYRPIPGASA